MMSQVRHHEKSSFSTHSRILNQTDSVKQLKVMKEGQENNYKGVSNHSA